MRAWIKIESEPAAVNFGGGQTANHIVMPQKKTDREISI